MVKSNYKYISGQKFIKLLKKHHGLEIISQKGSHIKVKVYNKITIIPNHKELAYGTFSGILKQLGINEIKFLEIIKE